MLIFSFPLTKHDEKIPLDTTVETRKVILVETVFFFLGHPQTSNPKYVMKTS